MNKLIVVIPFTTDNAVMAERLCDWIFKVSGSEQKGHALLVCDQQVHDELKGKVKIAAEVAFDSVELVVATVNQIPKAISSHFWMNLMFLKASEHISKHYRWPFLWLEPEAIPVKSNWLEILSSIYDSQPKRYLGTHMELNGHRFMARVGIYPSYAFSEFKDITDKSGPYEIAAGSYITPKCSRSKAFQHLKVRDESDVEKIREDATVVIGDESGIVVEVLREKIPSKKRIPIKKASNNE